MNKIVSFLLVFGVTVSILGLSLYALAVPQRYSDSEFEYIEESFEDDSQTTTYEQLYADWQRPSGPLRVGLQAGHWKKEELPDELARLRANGTSGGGTTEWEVVLEIAQKTARLIQEENPDVVVDIIPATVPPMYLADLFVAIHADGSFDSSVSGFKVSAPYSRRDLTKKGVILEDIFNTLYPESTGMIQDNNITRNMRGYYAFNWRRYEHSIHPMTPAIIVETGFLTSPRDQQILIYDQDLAAQGIANSVLAFLETISLN